MFCIILILIFFLSGERPSINADQQISKKRKISEDNDELKKKRKKKKSKTATEDVPIVIDLIDDENMPTTSGSSSECHDEMPTTVCLLFMNN